MNSSHSIWKYMLVRNYLTSPRISNDRFVAKYQVERTTKVLDYLIAVAVIGRLNRAYLQIVLIFAWLLPRLRNDLAQYVVRTMPTFQGFRVLSNTCCSAIELFQINQIQFTRNVFKLHRYLSNIFQTSLNFIDIAVGWKLPCSRTNEKWEIL